MTVSENGIEIQKRSLKIRATEQNISEASILRGLADQFKQEITETLQSLEFLETPPEFQEPLNQLILNQKLARDRLNEDSSYVLVYRQQELEAFYKQLLPKFGVWLGASKKARKMLGSSHLRRIEKELELSSDGSLTERCVRIASRVEILSPLMGGFNAKMISLVPALELFPGAPDCFHAACFLIASLSAKQEGNRLLIKNLRHHPEEFAEGVRLLGNIVEMAVGKRQTAEVRRPTEGLKRALAVRLYEGALASVIFHELAHFLTPPLVNEHHDEYKCDAFAAHVLSASHDPYVVCGLYIAQMLQDAIKAESEGWKSAFEPSGRNKQSTHPRTVFRIHRVATIAEDYDMMPTGTFDDLLAIPTRLMEEERFEHSTRWDVFSKLDKCFEKSKLELDAETRSYIPGALAMCVRLPTLAESTEVTLQPEGKMRARLVTFEMRKAIIAANMMLNRHLTENSSTSAERLAEAMIHSHKKAVGIALEGLAALSNQPKPPLVAVEVLNTLIPAKTREPSLAEIRTLSEPEKYKGGLESLKQLGCVTIEGVKVLVAETVKLRLVHRPRYE